MLLSIKENNIGLAYPLIDNIEMDIYYSADQTSAIFETQSRGSKMGGALSILLVFGFPHLVVFLSRIFKYQKPGNTVYAMLSVIFSLFGFLSLGAEVFELSKAALIFFLVCLSTWRYSKISSYR